MILTMVLMSYMGHGEDIQPNKPLSTFPVEIGDWLGQETRFDQEIYDAVGVDDSFLCNYQSSDGRQVQLYIGFYQSQREGDLIHSPKNCM
ncbi:MAG: EpsI family protein, partial [Deltaproteobacteria bacterium]|nr:EpsI family protein [Deltaproteobacteria bacterium]